MSEKKLVEEEVNFQKSDAFNLTMIPGAFARKMRTCLIWQFIRFVVINIKMIIVVGKSH
ncbi:MULTISPECIES: hypothetical protein [Sulfurimonas]|uniref:hypothetical protein n=1 Tax=Sulfurimonas TaxID=202746 RepID=UPI00165F3ABA|nr:hypothetical protein [Sulfurimonas indica]